MEKVKDILDKFIEKDLGVSRVGEEFAASRAWRSLKVKDLADNSAFDKLVGGVLYINAKNPAWAQRISLLKKDLMAKMNEIAGQTIKEIRVRAGAIADEVPAEKVMTEKKCPKCGVSHTGPDLHCTVCERGIRQQKASRIFRLVDENPRLSLAQARDIIPDINNDDFRRIKRDMNALKYQPPERKAKGNGKKATTR